MAYFFKSFFLANPQTVLPSALLSVCSPAPILSAVIESSCEGVTIVQTVWLLEEGPGFIQRSFALNAIKIAQVTSFKVGFRYVNAHTGLSL